MKCGNLKIFAQETRMFYDEMRKSIYGNYNGYNIVIRNVTQQKKYRISMHVSGGTSEQGTALSNALCALSRQNEYVLYAGYRENSILISMNSKIHNSVANLKEVLDEVTCYCRNNNMVSCCKNCENQTDISAYSVNGECDYICSSCIEKMRSLFPPVQHKEEKDENILTGIVGAFLGALIGSLVWASIYQRYYLAFVAGVLIGWLAKLGYEKFGGVLNTHGTVITIVISVIMVYFAENAGIALEICMNCKFDFLLSFKLIPLFLQEGMHTLLYILDLFIGCILVIAPFIPNINENKRGANFGHELICLERR